MTRNSQFADSAQTSTPGTRSGSDPTATCPEQNFTGTGRSRRHDPRSVRSAPRPGCPPPEFLSRYVVIQQDGHSVGGPTTPGGPTASRRLDTAAGHNGLPATAIAQGTETYVIPATPDDATQGPAFVTVSWSQTVEIKAAAEARE